MGNKKAGQEGVRKITKLGKKSLAVTLPIEMVKKLHWHDGQKVKVIKKHGRLILADWRSPSKPKGGVGKPKKK